MLTVKEAAVRACVSESLIYAWCAEGTLPHLRVGRKGSRGHIRIAVEDLDGALAAFKIQVVVGGGRGMKSAHPPLKHIKLR